MKLSKRLLRNPLVQSFLCWLAAQYIRLAYYTGRWQVIGDSHVQQLWKENKPFILCFWHGRLLMITKTWRRDKKISMLISSHPDGRFISKTVSRFGIHTISGSSSKGGADAMRRLLTEVRKNHCVGITPDGPRGPYMKASPGTIKLAKHAKVPLVPVTFSATRGIFMKSWDRFLVPFMFTKGIYIWGKPFYVSPSDDLEQKRQELEAVLTDLTQRADQACNRRTPEQGGKTKQKSAA